MPVIKCKPKYLLAPQEALLFKGTAESAQYLVGMFNCSIFCTHRKGYNPVWTLCPGNLTICKGDMVIYDHDKGTYKVLPEEIFEKVYDLVES
jgi:hypothetical protein